MNQAKKKKSFALSFVSLMHAHYKLKAESDMLKK